MPYIVTTKRPITAISPFASRGSFERDSLPVVSRVAVATLEEARHETERALIDWQRETGQKPDPRVHVYKARTLPESGGTVGPLPDGTTIEVEDLSLVEMYRRAGFEWDAHGPDAMVGLPEVLAAFSEANR